MIKLFKASVIASAAVFMVAGFVLCGNGMQTIKVEASEVQADVPSLFETYIQKTLVPQYGVIDTQYTDMIYAEGSQFAWDDFDLTGMLSATVDDFDDDGAVELLTVCLETYPKAGASSQIHKSDLYLRMYEYDSQQIYQAAEQLLEINASFLKYYDCQIGCFSYQYEEKTYIALDEFFRGYSKDYSRLRLFCYDGSQFAYIAQNSVGFDDDGGNSLYAAYVQSFLEYGLVIQDNRLENNWQEFSEEAKTNDLEYKTDYNHYIDLRMQDVYMVMEGNLNCLSGVSTSQILGGPFLLERVDYTGSLDQYRNQSSSGLQIYGWDVFLQDILKDKIAYVGKNVTRYLDGSAIVETISGVYSADVWDYDKDGQDELAVVRVSAEILNEVQGTEIVNQETMTVDRIAYPLSVSEYLEIYELDENGTPYMSDRISIHDNESVYDGLYLGSIFDAYQSGLSRYEYNGTTFLVADFYHACNGVDISSRILSYDGASFWEVAEGTYIEHDEPHDNMALLTDYGLVYNWNRGYDGDMMSNIIVDDEPYTVHPSQVYSVMSGELTPIYGWESWQGPHWSKQDAQGLYKWGYDYHIFHTYDYTGFTNGTAEQNINQSFSEQADEQPIENSAATQVQDAVVGQDGYIMPESDSRYLVVSDLENLTPQQICYSKNEIYAKHGRKFSSHELRDYFNSQPWYEGIIEPEDFTQETINALFNDYEIANVEFFSDWEENHGAYSPQ